MCQCGGFLSQSFVAAVELQIVIYYKFCKALSAFPSFIHEASLSTINLFNQ
jgi:hypothetical protein